MTIHPIGCNCSGPEPAPRTLLDSFLACGHVRGLLGARVECGQDEQRREHELSCWLWPLSLGWD